MSSKINLASRLKEYLPSQLQKVVEMTCNRANESGQRLYLVGGIVRDLLLGRPNFDLDLVVEGDALKLAQNLAKVSQAKLTTHKRFGTAKLDYKDSSLDITTARRETYAKPGALPTVTPGTIKDDLFRRDFTINAMAISLNWDNYGVLADPHNGKQDLDSGLIRILHKQSFTDDATRILRAIRYEQRLGFQIEPETLQLLLRDIPMLDTISSERIRYDLELILKEETPETILKRAHQLGVLQKLHPSLKGDGWLARKFEQARLLSKKSQLLPLYFSLLIYPLTELENEQFLSRINPPKKLAQVMRNTLQIKKYLSDLSKPSVKPSEIYYLLHGYQPAAIQTNAIATNSPVARRYLQLFLKRLRYVKPLLDGDDLKAMGIPTGPQLGRILKALHQAKLNNEVETKRDEEELVHLKSQKLPWQDKPYKPNTNIGFKKSSDQPPCPSS